MAESDAEDIVATGSPTEQLRLSDTAAVPITTPTELEALFADEDDAWPTQGPKRGFHVTWPVAALLVLLVAAGGIWGGAYMQRHTSSSSSSSLSSLFGSLRRGGAASSFAAAAANTTAGTVTDIIGNTLYVTTSSGSLVAVTISPNTTIDRDAKSTLSALQPGDTVTVQGTKSSNGTVAAGTVSATAAGVSTGFGFGGGGFGGFGRAATGGSGG